MPHHARHDGIQNTPPNPTQPSPERRRSRYLASTGDFSRPGVVLGPFSDRQTPSSRLRDLLKAQYSKLDAPVPAHRPMSVMYKRTSM